MTERAEHAALRIVKGHRSDTCHTVAHKSAQAVGPVFSCARDRRKRDRFVAALYAQRRLGVPVFRKELLQVLRGVDLRAVPGKDHVAFLETARFCA